MTPKDGNLSHALGHLVARWIGTPVWNFRFWLGYKIGGFTHAERTYE